MSTPWYVVPSGGRITSEYGWRQWADGTRHLHDGLDTALGVDAEIRIPVDGQLFTTGQTTTAGFYVGYQLSGILRWFVHRVQRRGRGVASPKAGDVVGYVGRRGTAAVGSRWDGGLARWSTGDHLHQRVELLINGTWTKVNPRDGRVAAELNRLRDEQAKPAGETGTEITEEQMSGMIVIGNGPHGTITVTDLNEFWLDTTETGEVWAYGTACGQFKTGDGTDAGVRKAIKDSGQELPEWRYKKLRADVLGRRKATEERLYDVLEHLVNRADWTADGIGGRNWDPTGEGKVDTRAVRPRLDALEKGQVAILGAIAKSGTTLELDKEALAALAPLFGPVLIAALEKADVATGSDVDKAQQAVLERAAKLPAETLAAFGLTTIKR